MPECDTSSEIPLLRENGEEKLLLFNFATCRLFFYGENQHKRNFGEKKGKGREKKAGCIVVRIKKA